MRRVFVSLAALIGFVCAAAAQTPAFPVLSGRIVDQANIIDGYTRDSVGRKLAEFEAKTGAEVVVATVPSLSGMDIDSYTTALARHWQLGQPGKFNGAILLIAPNAGKVAIQASQGLRDRLTDEVMGRIIRETLIPRLGADDIAGGVNGGIDDMLWALTVLPAQSGTAPVQRAAQLVSPAAAQSSLTFPQLTGRVVDDANILDSATRAELTQKLADLEAKSTDQLVIVTLRSLQGTSIEDYGYRLGRHWQIGQQGKNNGVLLIVAPNDRKVRIEVGYGLEGTLTDAISSFIVQNSILPRFRANDYPGGIKRGAEDIVQVLTGDAEEYKQRAAKASSPRTDSPDDLFLTIVIILFILAVLWNVYRSIQAQNMTPGRRSRDGSGWSGSSGGGSWSSGSSGGGGGGFSGGGGSFGGGGSSGSW